MPATGRPNTDYERWLQHHNPGVEINPDPQYGPESGNSPKMNLPVQNPGFLNVFNNPQISVSPTRKPIEPPSGDSSYSPTLMLLLVFVILVAIAFARTQIERSPRSRHAVKRHEVE
ncbi:hypothetical protein BDV29DRAFT_178674 [Aspergillus leporis]|uniref:Uncharacterized protein n=1 Tax=Aspergillus leporis TaxID=41062 RepID=A0A5N5WT52_9EURO|nr:hypothetical protein BDV29DRAFT_178674 [Aspergillus leporis]